MLISHPISTQAEILPSPPPPNSNPPSSLSSSPSKELQSRLTTKSSPNTIQRHRIIPKPKNGETEKPPISTPLPSTCRIFPQLCFFPFSFKPGGMAGRRGVNCSCLMCDGEARKRRAGKEGKQRNQRIHPHGIYQFV